MTVAVVAAAAIVVAIVIAFGRETLSSGGSAVARGAQLLLAGRDRRELVLGRRLTRRLVRRVDQLAAKRREARMRLQRCQDAEVPRWQRCREAKTAEVAERGAEAPSIARRTAASCSRFFSSVLSTRTACVRAASSRRFSRACALLSACR